MSHEIRHKANKGMAWFGLASSLVGVLDIVALVLILRFWVTPAEYGIAGLAVTLYPILDMATDLGLTSALVQGDDISPDRVSTVFWMNMGMSILLFLMLCGLAPLLGALQGHPVVGWMLIAYGSKLLFQNVYYIPGALLKRELRYRELSILRIFANLGEFAGKVGFAAAGFSLWCFVLGPLVRVLITGVGVQILNPWRPRFVMRWKEGWHAAKFGLRTSASQILFHFYTNADYQVVGYYFGAASLGLYRAAYEVILEPVRLISAVVVEVAFPVFARLKLNRESLIEQFVLFTRQNLVVVLPYLVIIMLVAGDALQVFFGAEWRGGADAARILCIVGAFRALSFVVPPLLDGVGKPQLTLTYMIVASTVVPALFIGCAIVLGPRFDYLSVAIAWAVGYPIAFCVLAYLALRTIEYSGIAYLRRVMGIPMCAALAIIPGAFARWLVAPLVPWARLLLVAATTMGALGVLLAYLQGISPRTIKAAMKGPPKPATPATEQSQAAASG
jgi:O-antigen/teichoic acid export membrane protein